MKQINVTSTQTSSKAESCCGETAESIVTGPKQQCGCSGGKTHLYQPAVDISETENEVLITADLPGASPEAIDVKFEKGKLSVFAAASPTAAAPRMKELRQEFNYGDFARTFDLGERIDPSKIRADYKNGVLTLYLPKSEVAKVHRIPINH